MADFKVLLQAMARPWYIDPVAAQKHVAIVDQIFSREGSEKWMAEIEKPAPENFAVLLSASGDPYVSSGSDSAAAVMVINIVGAVMKYDYCGAPGTLTIMAMIEAANGMQNVIAIILQIDSPGGSVDGTEQLASAIKNSVKPVVAFINGMMASAAVWFGSAASYRIASSNTDMIGSVGTYISWSDYTKYYEELGITSREIYATKSTQKNIEYRSAMGKTADGKSNDQPMIDNILDPTNQEFIDTVQSYLPDVSEEVFTGKIYMAKQAQKVGLIDKIGTFSDAIAMALKLAKKTNTNMANQNTTYTRALSAAGAESFEQVNEGIWLTPEQLGGIDQALISADSSLAAATDQLAEANTALSAAQESLATMSTLQTSLDTAQARIVELEKLPIAGATPVATTDPPAGEAQKDKYITSVDAEAAKLKAMLPE